MEQDKSIIAGLPSKTEQRQLTAKNRAFLQHLASGRPTIEAYHLAGYKGEVHAAYQLRSDLKQQLALLLEQGGFSREQLGIEINRLNELPLDPTIKNVNFKQKLDILRLMERATTKTLIAGDRPKITPFVVSTKVTVHDKDKGSMPPSVDTTVVGTDGDNEDLL